MDILVHRLLDLYLRLLYGSERLYGNMMNLQWKGLCRWVWRCFMEGKKSSQVEATYSIMWIPRGLFGTAFIFCFGLQKPKKKKKNWTGPVYDEPLRLFKLLLKSIQRCWKLGSIAFENQRE